MEEKQQTILVTGGAGFVGLHLTRQLLKNTAYRILVLENFMRGKKDAQLESLISTYPERLKIYPAGEGMPQEKVDTIFHLAALNGTKYFYEIPYELLRNNVMITINLLDYYKDKNVKFLYTSSSEVYADTDPAIPTAENAAVGFKDVYNPRWSYGMSKLFGEFAVINAGRNNPNFKYSIFRLHNVYGPRMGYEHVIPGFLKRMMDGENPMVIKNPDDTRAFCYVTDAVEAMMQLMGSKQAEGQIVHVGNPQEISVWELAQAMAKVFYDPAKLKKGEKLDIGSTNRRCPDITKLEGLTGFKPKVSLAEGLKLTYEYYKEAQK